MCSVAYDHKSVLNLSVINVDFQICTIMKIKESPWWLFSPLEHLLFDFAECLKYFQRFDEV